MKELRIIYRDIEAITELKKHIKNTIGDRELSILELDDTALDILWKINNLELMHDFIRKEKISGIHINTVGYKKIIILPREPSNKILIKYFDRFEIKNENGRKEEHVFLCENDSMMFSCFFDENIKTVVVKEIPYSISLQLKILPITASPLRFILDCLEDSFLIQEVYRIKYILSTLLKNLKEPIKILTDVKLLKALVVSKEEVIKKFFVVLNNEQISAENYILPRALIFLALMEGQWVSVKTIRAIIGVELFDPEESLLIYITVCNAMKKNDTINLKNFLLFGLRSPDDLFDEQLLNAIRRVETEETGISSLLPIFISLLSGNNTPAKEISNCLRVLNSQHFDFFFQLLANFISNFPRTQLKKNDFSHIQRMLNQFRLMCFNNVNEEYAKYKESFLKVCDALTNTKFDGVNNGTLFKNQKDKENFMEKWDLPDKEFSAPVFSTISQFSFFNPTSDTKKEPEAIKNSEKKLIMIAILLARGESKLAWMEISNLDNDIFGQQQIGWVRNLITAPEVESKAEIYFKLADILTYYYLTRNPSASTYDASSSSHIDYYNFKMLLGEHEFDDIEDKYAHALFLGGKRFIITVSPFLKLVKALITFEHKSDLFNLALDFLSLDLNEGKDLLRLTDFLIENKRIYPNFLISLGVLVQQLPSKSSIGKDSISACFLRIKNNIEDKDKFEEKLSLMRVTAEENLPDENKKEGEVNQELELIFEPLISKAKEKINSNTKKNIKSFLEPLKNILKEEDKLKKQQRINLAACLKKFEKMITDIVESKDFNLQQLKAISKLSLDPQLLEKNKQFAFESKVLRSLFDYWTKFKGEIDNIDTFQVIITQLAVFLRYPVFETKGVIASLIPKLEEQASSMLIHEENEEEYRPRGLTN